MVDPTDEFIKRLKTSADEARLRHKEARQPVVTKPKRDQRQIPISLFHDMFGEAEQYAALKRAKAR